MQFIVTSAKQAAGSIQSGEQPEQTLQQNEANKSPNQCPDVESKVVNKTKLATMGTSNW